MTNIRRAPVAGRSDVDAIGSDIRNRGIGDTSTDLFTTILSSVVGGVAIDVGIVQDLEDREVLPCETRLVLGAVRNVWSKHRPSP